MQNLFLISPAKSKWRLSLTFVLCIAALLAYADSFFGTFVLDDFDSVLSNSTIRSSSIFASLFPPSGGPVGGRPLTNLSFALNYRLTGIQPVGLHVTNFLIHVFSGLLIFAWLSEFLQRKELPDRIRRVSLYLSFICALLWLCHPISTNTVTYISQRSEGLMTLCYLLVIYSFWQWRSEHPNQGWPYIAVLFSFVGMGCKEGMATAPVMVLLIDRTFFAGRFSEALRVRWRFYSALFSSWIYLAYLYFHSEQRGVGYTMGVTWQKYALTESHVLIKYLKLIFYPDPLVFDYFHTVYRKNVLDQPYLAVVLFIVVGIGFLLYRKPFIGFVLAWFFILVAPTSSIIPIANQPMGENRIHLALLGPLSLAVVLCFYYLRSWAWTIFAGVACIFIQLTLERNAQYANPVSLWLDTFEKVPNNSRAANNLALALADERRFAEADHFYDVAIKLSPRSAESYAGKGDLALKRGQNVLAEKYFEVAVQKNPTKFQFWRSLGGIFFTDGRLVESESAFRKALERQGDDAISLTGLGNVLTKQGKPKEAMECYAEAVIANPDLAVPHNNLGSAFLSLGEDKKAMDEFKIAISLDPGNARFYINLATLYARSGEYDNAISHFLYGLRLDPSDEEARLNLGLAYYMEGKRIPAETCYRQVLLHDPENLRAKQLLAELQKNLN